MKFERCRLWSNSRFFRDENTTTPARRRSDGVFFNRAIVRSSCQILSDSYGGVVRRFSAELSQLMMAPVEPIMNWCEMAGFFLNEAVFPPDFKVCKHVHSRAGFCVAIAGGTTETYARKTRVYEPLTLEYLPAHEEHSLRVHRQGMRSFMVEFTWPAQEAASMHTEWPAS